MKNFLVYALEVAIAAVLIFIDQRLFWLYFFFIVIWLINQRANYLRRVIRVFQMANEVKLITIAEKLAISSEDFDRTFEKIRETSTPEKLESLEKDFREIS